MSRFACALLRDRGRWRVEEVDIAEVASVDDVLDLIRDETAGVRLVAIEQDDEYACLLRLDLDADDDAPLVFLSNGHAADDYPLAAVLADGLDEVGGDPLSDDEDAPRAHDTAPFGDPTLLLDLGMKPDELLELATHPATLPMDLIESVCERLGCLDEFEAVRG